MLCRKVDLHICIPVIIPRPARALLGILRLPRGLFPVFDQAHKRRCLLRLIDLITVASAGDGNRLPVGCLQTLRFIRSIIRGSQLLDILSRLSLIDSDTRSVHSQPVVDLISAQSLRLVTELISDPCPDILVHRLTSSL